MAKPQNIGAHTGLRGMAAIDVLIVHLALPMTFPEFPFFASINPVFLWSANAVDLFFILSGFVLNHVYLQTGPVAWRNYFVARFARIYPLFLATLMFLLGTQAYSSLRHGIPWSPDFALPRLLTNVTMLAGLYGNVAANCINYPSWSVCVEAALYVMVFPLLVVVYRVAGKWGPWFWTGMALLGVLGLISCYGVNELPDWPKLPDPLSALGRGVFGFTTGFALCTICRSVKFAKSVYDILGLVSLGLALAAILEMVPRSLVFPAFAGLVFSTTHPAAWVSRLFQLPLMEYLGERSYSLYLWHFPLIICLQRRFLYPHLRTDGSAPLNVRLFVWLAIPVVLFATAELSYRCFEVPLRQKLRALLSRKAGRDRNVSNC